MKWVCRKPGFKPLLIWLIHYGSGGGKFPEFSERPNGENKAQNFFTKWVPSPGDITKAQVRAASNLP